MNNPSAKSMHAIIRPSAHIPSIALNAWPIVPHFQEGPKRFHALALYPKNIVHTLHMYVLLNIHFEYDNYKSLLYEIKILYIHNLLQLMSSTLSYFTLIRESSVRMAAND